MNRLIPLALSASLATQSAFAGAPADPVIGAPASVEETAASSGGIVIPLLLLTIIAVTVADTGTTAVTSDERIKTDIKPVGVTAHGLPLYQFRYTGLPGSYEGVMAQDVARTVPDAVVQTGYGFMAVDYGKLGIEMRRVD